MPMIKFSNTDFYDDYARSKTGSVRDFLVGTTLEQLGVAKGVDVRMNMAQRGIAWGQKEADDLVRTLFGKMINDGTFRRHALACLEAGINPYRSGQWKAPAFLNQVSGQEKTDDDGNSWFSLTDGQQRSFSLRGIMAWSLARGVRLHGGKMDEGVFGLLMHKRGDDWVPRADYDQGDLGNASWKNAKGQRLGAMGYLLSPLNGGPKSDHRAMAMAMESRIKEFSNLDEFNAQGAHLVRLFKTMDNALDRMATLEPEASRETLLNLLTTGALEAMIKVQVLGKDMDAELNVVHSNDTGKGMDEVERIGATLTLFGRDPQGKENQAVAGAVRTLFNQSEYHGGKSGAPDLIKMTYLVSAALSSGDLSFLGLVKANENKTKHKFETLLRDAKNPTAMARKIGHNLERAFGAVLLARKGIDLPEITKDIDDGMKQAMIRYQRCNIRGAGAALAWMSMETPEDARKLLPLLELLAGERLAAGGLLQTITGNDSGRQKTEVLDQAIDSWSAEITPGRESGYYAKQLAKMLTRSDKGYGMSNHKQVDSLLELLGNKGKGGITEGVRKALADKITNGVMKPQLSSMFQSVLGISDKDIERGVMIVSGNRQIGLLDGANSAVLLGGGQPKTIDMASVDYKRMHRTSSKMAWAFFGGKPKPNKELSLEEEQAIQMRKARRSEDVERLVVEQRKRGKSNKTLEAIKSKASVVARALASDKAWKLVSVNAGVIEKIYKHNIHQLNEKDQNQAIRDLLPEVRRKLRA